ncbi:MAG TPA: DUF6152 family protein [Gammaproteobacteria bacterium]
MNVTLLTRTPLRRTSAAIGFLFAAVLALAAHTTFAHHSVAANFDNRRTVEVKGTITAVHLRNPHSQYVLAVPAEDGTTEEWLIEWSDRNALVRRKVDLDRIKVGDEVTITVWPSRHLDRVGFFVQAVLADGSIFRDCGFREFREAVVNSSEFRCPEASGE